MDRFEDSKTAKMLKLNAAARQLAGEYEAEGKSSEAAQVRAICSLPMDSAARLYDILNNVPPAPRPMSEVIGATENIGSL